MTRTDTYRAVRLAMAVAMALAFAAALFVAGASIAANATPKPAPQPAPQAAPLTLDSDTLIIVRHETPEGVEVAPPETMPLWRYVEVERGGKDSALRSAIEADLHAQDATFHYTHEEIDGKTWAR